MVFNSKIPRSTIYSWIKEKQSSNTSKKKEVNLRNFRALEKKVARLEGIIEILQNIDCTVNAPLNIKLAALEELYGQYSVHMIYDSLKVPRGTFCNHIFRNKRDNTWYAKRREEFKIRIQEIYDENNQIFGSAKITAIMKEKGYHISIGMVSKLMQDMGLTGIRQDAKDLYDKERKKYKNYLNQEFTATRPNEIWVSDVTYFKYKNKIFYICAILDLYSRMVVGFYIRHKTSTQLTKNTFKQAYKNREPVNNLLFHTGRGSNCRSNTFCSYLTSLSVTQSFSRAHYRMITL
ncbi:MAG: IS3 family transposase [Clostridiales bacterium]|nr:IS3 family transposase [Clostridiales bacterium]